MTFCDLRLQVRRSSLNIKFGRCDLSAEYFGEVQIWMEHFILRRTCTGVPGTPTVEVIVYSSVQFPCVRESTPDVMVGHE
jgi:hypothetical protein